MKFKGEAYEFDVEYINGPYDGSEAIVISFTDNKPPKVTFERFIPGKSIPIEKKKIGAKMLQECGKRTAPDDDKVAVYELEGNPDNFFDTEEILKYKFKEIIDIKTYKEKYDS